MLFRCRAMFISASLCPMITQIGADCGISNFHLAGHGLHLHGVHTRGTLALQPPPCRTRITHMLHYNLHLAGHGIYSRRREAQLLPLPVSLSVGAPWRVLCGAAHNNCPQGGALHAPMCGGANVSGWVGAVGGGCQSGCLAGHHDVRWAT